MLPLLVSAAAFIGVGACHCEPDEPEPLPPEVMAEIERQQAQMLRDEEEILGRSSQNALLAAMGVDPSQRSKAVAPISAVDLAKVLTQIEGWKREPPSGGSDTFPYPYTSVATVYRKGSIAVEVSALDSGRNPILTMPFELMTQPGAFGGEAMEGERAIKIGGHPAWEQEDRRRNESSLGVLVDKRYMVTLKTLDGASLKDLHRLVTALDLDVLPVEAATTPPPPHHPSSN